LVILPPLGRRCRRQADPEHLIEPNRQHLLPERLEQLRLGDAKAAEDLADVVAAHLAFGKAREIVVDCFLADLQSRLLGLTRQEPIVDRRLLAPRRAAEHAERLADRVATPAFHLHPLGQLPKEQVQALTLPKHHLELGFVDGAVLRGRDDHGVSPRPTGLHQLHNRGHEDERQHRQEGQDSKHHFPMPAERPHEWSHLQSPSRVWWAGRIRLDRPYASVL